MSCETNYAKLEKQIPEMLQTPTSTGYGNMYLLLRIRAAKFWRESLVTLSDEQLRAYCKYIIDYMYPNLHTNNAELYNELAFVPLLDSGSPVYTTDLFNLYNYQWWLGNVTGPESCTRDIAYLCALLDMPVREDWYPELETRIIEYQSSHVKTIEQVTGYGCGETLKRLRLLQQRGFEVL